MSTQVLEKETTHATELTAEAMQNALDRREATRNYAFTVTIFERFGRTFIGWQLDSNYAVGSGSVVQLREGDRLIHNWPVTGTSGEVDTGHDWGTGLNASYWARNFSVAGDWRQLVVTPNT